MGEMVSFVELEQPDISFDTICMLCHICVKIIKCFQYLVKTALSG